MLRTLKELFDTFASSAKSLSSADVVHHQHLATTVLLVEVVRADPSFSAAERDAVIAALRRKFALADDELERLVEVATRESDGLYDYHRFTNLLNGHFTHPQKIAVVEAMWEVAYADAHIDAHENHLIGKVSGLLHVTHGEYIAAKMRAKEASGLG